MTATSTSIPIDILRPPYAPEAGRCPFQPGLAVAATMAEAKAMKLECGQSAAELFEFADEISSLSSSPFPWLDILHPPYAPERG